MKITKINDIEIQYDDSQEDKISNIKNVINNNYNLFLDILGTSKILSITPTDDKDIIYLSDFDKTFYNIVDKIFNDKNNILLMNDIDFLSALLMEALSRKYFYTKDTFWQLDLNITDEMLYNLIAYMYFEKNGSFELFVDYLKNRKDNDKILNWFQNETRFKVYNYLLEGVINYFEQYDSEFLKKLDYIIEKIEKMISQNFIDVSVLGLDKEQKLPSISLEEVERYFFEFLYSINAPQNWQQTYIDLKSGGNITFKEQINNIDDSKCYVDNDGVIKILITTDGTIDGFITLVHEFTHYISKKNRSGLPPLSIEEFPSIFFEKLAIKFLSNKGLTDVAINILNKKRIQNNIENYMELFTILNDISRFVNVGPILKADKIKSCENKFRIVHDENERLIKLCKEKGIPTPDINFLEEFSVNIEDIVNKNCDALIESFIQNGLLVINGYQYLLSTFLADEVLKKYNNDSSIIKEMIQITNKLSNNDLEKILISFDLKHLFEPKVISDKVKKN